MSAVACGWLLNDGRRCDNAAIGAVVLGEARVPACGVHVQRRAVVPLPPLELDPVVDPAVDPVPEPTEGE